MQFEAAAKAKPDYADAHYWVGMASLNTGAMPAARAVVRELSEVRADRAVRRAGEDVPGSAAEVTARRDDHPPRRSSPPTSRRCGSASPAPPRRTAGPRTRSGSSPSPRPSAWTPSAPRSTAGHRDFGENRVQEALPKIEALAAEHPDLRWHLIGHLQSNKARKAGRPFDAIHSVDSLDLLRRLDDAAAEGRRRPQLLVQVDLAGEATKFGAPPDEARAIVREADDARRPAAWSG